MNLKYVALPIVVLIGFFVVGLPSGVYANEGPGNASIVKIDNSTMLWPVWHKIVKIKKELNEVVKSGNLKTVHEFAFAIRDLSKELLKRTTDKDLSEKQMSNVKNAVQRIAEVATALDEYGDARDQANTVKELKRFNSLIDFIETQYSESGK